jgi:heme A synthase
VFRRSSDTWAPQDFFGLRVILELTLASVLFGLVPSWISLSPVDEPTALRLSSALLAIFVVLNFVVEVLRVRECKRRNFSPRHPRLMVCLLLVPEIIAFAALLMNVISWANAAIYAGAIIFLLFAASVQFFVLVSPSRTGVMEPMEGPR